MRERMPQLDSLRAIAVGAVMLHHFYAGNFLSRSLPLATLGVGLFFVLSGFLITGILREGEPTGAYLVGFYFRRAARLLPLYYVVVAILLAVNASVQSDWPYYILHNVNLCMAVHGRICFGAHFWTLAVEEQFYFFWPFAVLFLTRRRLIILCWFLIVGAPIYRTLAAALLQTEYTGYLLPGSMDLLAAGGLLSLNRRERAWFISPVAAIAGILIATGLFNSGATVLKALVPTALAPLFCWLVFIAARGVRGFFGRFLSHALPRYLGRISYGIYVIHNFMPSMISAYLPVGMDPYIRSVIFGVGTLALAALSWHLFESPINRWRDRIYFDRPRAPALSDGSVH